MTNKEYKKEIAEISIYAMLKIAHDNPEEFIEDSTENLDNLKSTVYYDTSKRIKGFGNHAKVRLSKQKQG